MRFRSVLLLIVLPLILPAQETPAADPLPKPRDSGAFFFEATSQYLSFASGDLDGNLVVGNADQVFHIPRIKSSLGFGIGFGRRFRSGLWAVSYIVSGHDANFQDRDSTAVLRQVQVNARTFLFKTSPLRLFLQLGLSFPWLRVRDDVADRNGKFHDATYAGVGANAGAGILTPVSSRMFFSAGLVYRFTGFLYAYGPVKGIDVTDLFDNVTGPRHSGFLKAPVLALELSLGYEL
jgi:hypothetical protein